MSTVESLARRLQQGGLGPHPHAALNQLRVRLIRELAMGKPIETERVQRMGLELGLDREMLLRLDETLIDCDEEGRIVGVAGLSLTSTRHRFIVGDQTLYTWCTLDGLYMVPILGRSGRLETHCLSAPLLAMKVFFESFLVRRADSSLQPTLFYYLTIPKT